MNARFVNSRRVLLLVLAIAFALRIVAAWSWQSKLDDPDRFAFGDSEGYWVLARAVANGGPYQYGSHESSVFRTPGYPILLAPLFLIWDNPPVLAGRVIGAILGTATVSLIYWLGVILFDRRAALLAAAIWTIYPAAIGMSVFILSEAPFTFFLVLQLAFFCKAWQSAETTETGDVRKRAKWWAIAAGAATACAVLVRPSWFLWLPFAIIFGLMFSRDRRRVLSLGFASAIGLIALMAPWWIRNAVVIGQPVVTTLQAGASLYDGLNPRATGASDMSFVQPFAVAARATFTGPPPPWEVYLDSQFAAASRAWAFEHPAEVVSLAIKKFVRMWSPLPNEPSLRSGMVGMSVLLTYPPLLLAGTWGAAKWWRRSPMIALCALPAVYLALIHMIFVSSIRYREPALACFAIFAAALIVRATPRITS